MRRLKIVFFLAFSNSLWAQASPNMAPGYQQTYDRLLQQIRQIAIFDDHGHPGFAEDTDVDAMASPPGHAPLRLSLDNPELIVYRIVPGRVVYMKEWALDYHEVALG